MSQPILRLAMRQEGAMWNAYAAKPDTMKDAHFIGSIAIAFVQTDERRHRFLALMTDAFADLIEQITGERPLLNAPIAAPESERSGHA